MTAIVRSFALAALVLVAGCQPSPDDSHATSHVAAADQHPPSPDEHTFDGQVEADHNRELYGHPWGQTHEETAADALWQPVADMKDELIGEGGDYRAYNVRLTAAYRRWEAAEQGAYGPGWRALWQNRHTGDILGECGSMQSLGMTRDECVSTERAQGEVEPLEPMLLKCSPGGIVMPHDLISCRTHGRYSTSNPPPTNGDPTLGPEGAEATPATSP